MPSEVRELQVCMRESLPSSKSALTNHNRTLRKVEETIVCRLRYSQAGGD